MVVDKIHGGVSRFQKHVYPKHQKLFKKLAIEQKPEALFITCADSRIDPTMLTQTKPGRLFICRVIGNIVPPYPNPNDGVSSTIEYAVGVLNVPVVIVCGHTDCGVIKGAVSPDALTPFPDVSNWLRFAKVPRAKTKPTAKQLLSFTEQNVVTQLKNLATHPAIAARLAARTLILQGWVYHIGPGNVTSYDAVTKKFKKLGSRRRPSPSLKKTKTERASRRKA